MPDEKNLTPAEGIAIAGLLIELIKAIRELVESIKGKDKPKDEEKE